MNILGFDTETTGIEWAEGHRILELAAILYRDGQVSSVIEKRFNPQRPVDPKAQEVHGITFEMVSGCPLFESVAPAVSKLFNSVDVLVAHNGKEFDIPFLNSELRRAGVPEVTTPVIDTSHAKWATAFGKTPTLGELCFALGVPYDSTKAHAARYDVEVMMQAFERARAKGYFTIPEREERIAA